jgi:L-methionine (R)-S-oxide reductase
VDLARLFRLVHEDARPAKARLGDAVAALHGGRNSWTGIYVLSGDTLELAASVGPETPHPRIPIGKGLCGRAVTSRRDLDVGDVNAEPEYLACSLSVKSEAIVLIWHKGEIVGQIDIDSETPGPFGAEQMQALATAAHVLAPLVLEVRGG